MNNIDQRIVEMDFNNKQFEKGVKTSLGTLEDLKKGLNLDASAASLDNLNKVGSRFSLAGIAAGVDSLANRFSTLGIIGMTIIQSLTNAALGFAKKMTSALISPIVEGGKARAQAIAQAKFQFEGLGMDVEKTMANALAAVKGTAYGLGDAALVASQLGASGMRAGDQMTKSLRAVAGVAAMTGRSYSEIGQIFTTVAGNGRLMGDQLLQLSSKGINVAASMAKTMHKTEAEVRQMVSDGQISFQMFSDAMDDAYGQHAKDANKLFVGALANNRAALSRIGADVATTSFENLRDVLNALTPVVDQVHEKIMPLINSFNKFTTELSKTTVIKLNWFEEFNKTTRFLPMIVESIQHFLSQIGKITSAIRTAFKNVFPPANEMHILDVVHTLRDMVFQFNVSQKAFENIYSAAHGFFSILDILVKVIGTLIKGAALLLRGFIPLGNIILSISGSIGHLISSIDGAITSTNIFGASIDNCTAIGKGFSKIFDGLNNTLPFFSKLAQGVANVFGGMFKGIRDGLSGLDVDKLFDLINGGLFGVVLLNLSNFIQSLGSLTKKGGPFSGIIGLFDDLRGTLKAMQSQVKAKTLMEIAAAVGILSLSLVALSSIKPERLATALGAISILFVELGVALKMFSKVGPSGIKQTMLMTGAVTSIALAMLALATAVLILSKAMAKLAKLSWGEIAKGILSVAALAGILIGASKLIGKSSKTLMKNSIGFIIFAEAINILVKAVVKIGKLDWGKLAKGIVGVGALAAELVIFSKVVNNGGLSIKSSLSILLLAAALNVLAIAVKKIGNTNGLKKGLVGMALVLAEITIFAKTNGNSKNLIATAIGLNILGVAINIIAKAVKTIGNTDGLKKGLLGMGIALGIIVVAMKGMTSALPGAAALLVVAVSLGILAPILKVLGNMSIPQIAKSLGMLAGAFVVLGLAGLVLTPLIPTLLGLGVVFTLIGAGCALAGVGLVAISAGIASLVLTASAGSAVLATVIEGIILQIPKFFEQLALGFVEFCKVIAKSGSTITGAMKTILLSLIQAISDVIPKLVQCGVKMVLAILKGLGSNIGKITKAAINIVVNFINAVASQVPKLINAGFNLLISVINGIADGIRKNNKKLIKAVWNLLDAFVDAGLDWLASVPEGLWKIGKGIVSGIIEGIKQELKKLEKAASNLGDTLLKGVMKFLGIKSPSKEFMKVGKYSVQGLAAGIDKFGSLVGTSATNLGKKAMSSLGNAVANISDMVNGSIDISPKIRPVIDLTSVNAGSRKINSLMNSTKGFDLTSSISQAVSGSNLDGPATQPSNGSSYSFVQNNYSPKELSRIDIYRQTNNQFSMLKGLVNAK